MFFQPRCLELKIGSSPQPKATNVAWIMIECNCFFARQGRFKLEPFEIATCKKRKRQFRKDRVKRRTIANRCNIYDVINGPMTSYKLKARQDVVFKRCPIVQRQLCLSKNSYDVVECTCFVIQSGIINGNKEYCDRDFGKLTPKNRPALIKRCISVVEFNLYGGAFLGITLRYCQMSFKSCCNTVPDLPPPPPPTSA